MTTVQIHRTIQKQTNTQFVIGFNTITTDPRDKVYINLTNNDIASIVLPWTNMIKGYPGYTGFNRQYLDDNTLDMTYNFNLDANTNVNVFAQGFVSALGNTNNTIVQNFVNFVANNNSTITVTYSFVDPITSNTIVLTP